MAALFLQAAAKLFTLFNHDRDCVKPTKIKIDREYLKTGKYDAFPGTLAEVFQDELRYFDR